jgi:hypothetical protein
MVEGTAAVKSQETNMRPSDAAILERAFSLVNEGMFTVELQRRRIRSAEPEDEKFIFRRWADLQFLVVALRRLRRAAQLAGNVPSVAQRISSALGEFDDSLPGLARMRNVGEHIADYALDNHKRHHKRVDPHQVQVGTLDGTTYEWLDMSLNVDDAHQAATKLYSAVQTALRDWPRILDSYHKT